MKKEQHYSDGTEKIIGDALGESGIKFNRNQRLDFYLPEYDIYIEVKRFHSPRGISQLESQENVILIQGLKTAKVFAKLINRQL